MTFFIVFILLSKSLICILYIVFCNEKEWIILIDFPREKKILKHKNKLFLLSKMYWPLLDNNSFSWQKIDFYCSQSTIKSTNSNLLRCGYCPYPVSSFNLDYLNLEYTCNCSFQPNFLTNRNEQELMEICITRLTSAIRETRWLQKQNSI